MSENTKLELLAPARNLESGKTAVDYGADALYIGGPTFGARAAAGNSIEDIARLAEYAHPFGVRVYAALNTLIFDDELESAEKTARELISAGVDALIIQDMAFLRMGLEGVEFHASTQTCNVDPAHIDFLGKAGFSRVILERGLTFDEIVRIRAATDVELECFVHGAICVGFSGQCYLSRSMCRRSGNRGDCMQGCRLPYDLIGADGRIIMRNKHLLSVSDLDLSARIGELADAGITSFKIEGRLKDENYVKNAVAFYRQALDRVIGERTGFSRSSSGQSRYDFTPDPASSFTRGGSEWTFGGAHRGMASFDTPKATGVYIGTVESASNEGFYISACKSPALHETQKSDPNGSSIGIASGDGICFMAGGELRGTYVNSVQDGIVRPDKMYSIAKGTKIYRNYNKTLDDALRRSRTRRTIAVTAELTFASGSATLRLTDEDGVSVSARMETDGKQAHDPQKMTQTLRTQIAKSGGTIFEIDEVRIAPALGEDEPAHANTTNPAEADYRQELIPIEMNIVEYNVPAIIDIDSRVISGVTDRLAMVPFITVSAINDLRRKALDALLSARMKRYREIPAAADTHAAAEDLTFQYPHRSLGGQANVTNGLAERFYRDHGVEKIEKAFDLRKSLTGECVMTSAYCIRREIGECLRKNPRLKGGLRLRHGEFTYRLEFDCAVCRMKLFLSN